MNIHSIRVPPTRRIKNRWWKMMALVEKAAANLLHSSVIPRRGECARRFVVHLVQRLGVSRFMQLFDKGAQQKCHVRLI